MGDQRLARLLGVHTQTRPVIISALWQYIKTHKLQDQHEKEFVNCDPFLKQIFQTDRMKFAEIPQRLNPLLHPPDPIVINHMITVEELKQAETKKTACYDIDVEVDDTLKTQMNNFLLSTASQQEIQSLDNKIQDYDGRDWKPRGREEGRLLLSTLGHRRCLQILLRENPAEESRVGLQLGCAQLLGQQQNIVSRVNVSQLSWNLEQLTLMCT